MRKLALAALLAAIPSLSTSARADVIPDHVRIKRPEHPQAARPAVEKTSPKPETKAAEKEAVTAAAAFDKLKSLAGEWQGHVVTKDGPPGTVVYRVASGGHAVLETLFPGTDHEMMTVYYVDHDDLRGTHYCGLGNQPEFKLDRAASKPDDLVFAFAGGRNFDPAKDAHIHQGRIHLVDGKLENEWDAFAGGKLAGAKLFYLARSAK